MAVIKYEEDIQNAISAGWETLWHLAAPMYGPNRGSVWFKPRNDIPMAAHSISQILDDFSMESGAEQIGVDLIRRTVKQVVDQAGTGAGTAVVLACAMLQEGRKAITAGHDAVLLRKGALEAAEIAAACIQRIAVPLDTQEKAEQLIRTSMGDNPLCGIVLEAVEKAGMDGTILVDDSQQTQTTVHHAGIQYDYGYCSNLFANDETKILASLNHPKILLVDQKIDQFEDLRNVLTQAMNEDQPLLIIAREFSKDVLALLLRNVQKKILNVVAANAPGFGQTRRRNMEALAVACGAVLIDEHCGYDLSTCGLEICGEARYAQVGKDFTKLSDPICRDQNSREIMLRRLRREVSEEKNEDLRENYQLAMAMLSGSSVLIRVGGSSEIEMFEQKREIENAIRTIHAARESGIVPGGGSVMVQASQAVRSYLERITPAHRPGALCVANALLMPIRLIADNAGYSGSYIVHKVQEADECAAGFDVRTGEIANMADTGIWDTEKTVVTALRSAAETVFTTLTIQAGVYGS